MQRTKDDPPPLGAVWDGNGVHFSLISENADGVDLCLFDNADSPTESHRVALTKAGSHLWRANLPGLQPGQLYGYRVYGRFDPKHGHWFNPAKLLLDPYAKALGRAGTPHPGLYYLPGHANNPPHMQKTDTGKFAPLGMVADTRFDWGDDRPPAIPWEETVLYETHVKGLTRLHPGVAEPLRGTFSALATAPIIEHLKHLGITALELLPVQLHWDEAHLTAHGLTNYWGYNTLNFFIPDRRFASPGMDPAREFKTMVRALHREGIEVILDVAFNHTAEGNHQGPTLSYRGIDNALYYRLHPDKPHLYHDVTGCGNTMNFPHPAVLDLVLDSLRYWVAEMHVDGFRFDLAATLGRAPDAFDASAPFFSRLADDPILSRVKLIAEPWDLGPDSYQAGNFPAPWREWNGLFRDDVRRFWRGDRNLVGLFASRFAGSSDVYAKPGRTLQTSVNLVTCHDGFTLRDLVSYEHKHNEHNMEENRDGHNDNNSWNCGVEGPTHKPDILAQREKLQRNLIATVCLAFGVPMLSGGDEIGRTQRGNNNAYCQDNEIAWLAWEETDARQNRLLTFTRQALALRKNHSAFRRADFFTGRPAPGSTVKDITWLTAKGREMADADWRNPDLRSLGILVLGNPAKAAGERLLILINADTQPISFHLAVPLRHGEWTLALDTHEPDRAGTRQNFAQHPPLLPPQSLLAFQSPGREA
jgi:glycogen operon protein